MTTAHSRFESELLVIYTQLRHDAGLSAAKIKYLEETVKDQNFHISCLTKRIYHSQHLLERIQAPFFQGNLLLG